MKTKSASLLTAMAIALTWGVGAASAEVSSVGAFGAWSLTGDTSFVDQTSVWSLRTSDGDASLIMRCDPQLDEVNLIISAAALSQSDTGHLRVAVRVTDGAKQSFRSASSGHLAYWTSNDPQFSADFKSLLALLSAAGSDRIGFKVDSGAEWVFPLDGFSAGWTALAERCPTASRIH